MKKLLSVLLVLALALTLLPCAAFADSGAFDDFSDDDLKYWYEEARKEMVRRGLSLTQELTLREGKFIVGQDIEPGTYMTNRVNTDKNLFETEYDDVMIPIELAGVHPKAAIRERNRWMVDWSDMLLACVYRDFGGAYDTV